MIGNWLEPPEELHLGRLLSDEVVCLVAENHPLAKSRSLSVERWLDCQHLAPMPLSPGQPGVIDQHLAQLGLSRHIAVRSAHFGQLPEMVARSLLVLTTGRLFCSRYLDQLPVRIVRCPVSFPPMAYYQLSRAQPWPCRPALVARAGARGRAGPGCACARCRARQSLSPA